MLVGFAVMTEQAVLLRGEQLVSLDSEAGECLRLGFFFLSSYFNEINSHLKLTIDLWELDNCGHKSQYAKQTHGVQCT